eukprot:Colp12_sorted_trinity150504_noHs@12872
MPSIQRKTAIVTGANAGIGLATCKELAAEGWHVIMVCRDQARGQAALEELKAEVKDSSAEVAFVDLASFKAVRTFAKKINDSGNAIDALVNNAGIMMGSADGWFTDDGCNRVMQVNYLSHFLLVLLLLPALKKAPRARVVNVASQAHYFSYVDFKNFNGCGVTGMLCYGQSKLCNIMFCYELARRLKGTSISVFAADPGPTYTNFYEGLGWPVWLAFRPFLWLMRPSKKGAETVVHCVTSSTLDGKSGVHLFDLKDTPTSKASQDQNAQKRLWDLSIQLVGLEADPLPVK